MQTIAREFNPQSVGADFWDGDGPAARVLTKDEALRIAANIAKLPELMRKSGD